MGNPSIAVYSAVTGAQVQAIANPCSSGPYTWGTSVFPNGKSIAVSCSLSAFAVNIHTGGATALALPADTGIAAMAVSPNSKYIAIGLNNGNGLPSVLVFSATSGALLHTYVGSKSSVWSVAFSSDSQTIVAGSSNGLLNFWDFASQKLLQTYNQETGDSKGSVCNCPDVSSIAYSADNKYVYYGRNDASSVLIDNPVYFPIASLGLSAGSVIGGTSLTGTATITVPAPSYGAKILLTSSDSAVAAVPASVKIPAGQTSATFTITTTAQTAPAVVTITANSTGTVQMAALTVLPQPALTAVTLSPPAVTGGASTTNNTVTLSSAAPTGGVTVALSSSNTAAAVTPVSIVVPAGATVSPAFTITTSPVSAQTGVTISAAYNGSTQQATLTVN
jgi:WD40 repeat protein